MTAMGDYTHLPVGTLSLDADLVITSADARFCDLFQCDAKQVVSKALDDLFSPKDRRGTMQFHSRLVRYDGGMLDTALALRIASKDFYARLRMKRIATGWVVHVENALERGFVYDMLLAQERWLSVFSGSEDGIAILDAERRLIEYNRRFFEVMQFRSQHGVALSEDAALGRSFFELVATPEFEPMRRALDRNVDSGAPFRDAFPYHGRYLAIRVGPISLPLKGGVGHCLILRDTTEQRHLEELRIKESQAHWVGMAEIATNVLHNLGNLCTGVIYAAEEIQRLTRESKVAGIFRANELLAQYQEQITESLARYPKLEALPSFYLKLGEALKRERGLVEERARDLMTNVHLMKEVIAAQQDYARGTAFTEPVSLQDVVRDALTIQNGGLERHGVTVVRKFANVPPVRAQRSKLSHVLINLIKNATEAMQRTQPSDRKLTVEVAAMDDGGACVRIADTGEGIPPEKLDKIFMHGFTTKDSGHGFGLHFCSTAMLEMGGELTVDSAGPGLGATFTLTFEIG